MKHHSLAKELQQVGASSSEIKALLPIASRLGRLKTGRTPVTADRAGAHFGRKMLKPAAFTIAGLALGMLFVVVSQTALPTSVLHPVQQLSDNVAVRAYPPYRAIIMMKRAQQVNRLVAAHANSSQVLATLHDYTAEAKAYQSSPHADYAAFEFCKTNLQQAAEAASPEVKQAIAASLQSLDTT